MSERRDELHELASRAKALTYLIAWVAEHDDRIPEQIEPIHLRHASDEARDLIDRLVALAEQGADHDA